MISVKVTYSVKKEYAQTNKQKIATFLNDFQKLDSSQFSYTIFQQEDGSSFLHLSQYENEQIQQELLQVPSFIAFQKSRDEYIEVQPTIEILNFVGSSKQVF